MAPPTFFMLVVGEVLHLWLGWPLWVGVVIVGILATGPGVVQLLGGKATDNEETEKIERFGPKISQERSIRIGFALFGNRRNSNRCDSGLYSADHRQLVDEEPLHGEGNRNGLPLP
jgi:hypothetical protein